MAEVICLADHRRCDLTACSPLEPVEFRSGDSARDVLIKAVRSLPDGAEQRADQILLVLASRGFLIERADGGVRS